MAKVTDLHTSTLSWSVSTPGRRRLRETRSGFLQRLAERELERAEGGDREEIDRLLDAVRPIDFGGVTAAQLIREDRESR